MEQSIEEFSTLEKTPSSIDVELNSLRFQVRDLTIRLDESRRTITRLETLNKTLQRDANKMTAVDKADEALTEAIAKFKRARNM